MAAFDYFTDAFRKYADFKGRATRTAYWMYILFYFLIYIGLAMVEGMLFGLPILSGIFALIMLIPSLAYGARRLHDMGRSGWWQLLLLIPLIGPIVVLIFTVLPSQGDNEYGAAAEAA